MQDLRSMGLVNLNDVDAKTGTGTTVPLQDTPEFFTPVIDQLGAATPVVAPHEDTVIPAGARAYQEIRSIPFNFDDVPGTTVRLIGVARHYHEGTPEFTDGKVRLKINGSTVYTSGTVGTGADNATGATLDSGLQSYSKPSGVATILVEGEAELNGANESRVVLKDWNLVFK